MRMGARGGIWQVEYRSNYLAFLRMKARVGIEIDVVDNDASGEPRGSESTNSTHCGPSCALMATPALPQPPVCNTRRLDSLLKTPRC